jgi:Flp pilus assembly protein TadG
MTRVSPPPRWSTDAAFRYESPRWVRIPAALLKLPTDQRGTGTVELVIATPVLLLLILFIIQGALDMHARNIAQAAASEALSATRVSGGSITAGTTEANRVLSQLGNGPLHASSVNVRRTATQASVTITGTVTNVVPFFTFTVHGDAVGPVERFTAGARP